MLKTQSVSLARMSSVGTPTPEQRPGDSWWRYVVRTLLSLVAAAAVVWWQLVALFLWGFRCDENCGEGDYDRWDWTGQAVLAGVGAIATFAALALGFTRHRRAYHVTLAAAATLAYVWWSWVIGSGTF